MHITVRFFAILKDRAGVSESSIELPANSTVAAGLDAIRVQFPAVANDLKRSAIAVNRSYSDSQKVLNDGDELALIPPVSGG